MTFGVTFEVVVVPKVAIFQLDAVSERQKRGVQLVSRRECHRGG